MALDTEQPGHRIADGEFEMARQLDMAGGKGAHDIADRHRLDIGAPFGDPAAHRRIERDIGGADPDLAVLRLGQRLLENGEITGRDRSGRALLQPHHAIGPAHATLLFGSASRPPEVASTWMTMALITTTPPISVLTGGTSLTARNAQTGPKAGSTSASSANCAAGTLREARVNRTSPRVNWIAPMKMTHMKLLQPIENSPGPKPAAQRRRRQQRDRRHEAEEHCVPDQGDRHVALLAETQQHRVAGEAEGGIEREQRADEAGVAEAAGDHDAKADKGDDMAAKLARLTRSPSSHQPRKAAQNGAMPLMKIDCATVV